MIEKLFDEERQYGETAQRKFAAEIAEIQRQLDQQLDQEGRRLLERLSDLYLLQGSTELRDAFTEGFSVAVELLLESLRR